MENNSENVKKRKLLHDNSYKREKEFLIDNKISVDFIRRKNPIEVHEIKKTKKMKKSHEYQLLYYLYYLKNNKNIKNIIGYLNYPLIKESKEISLTKENEVELKKIIKNIKEIIEKNRPPLPEKKKICKSCAYYELCFI